MTRMPDVAIIGGGIVGAATAYYLGEAGVSTVVIERDAVGSHASGHAYGGLSAMAGPRGARPDAGAQPPQRQALPGDGRDAAGGDGRQHRVPGPAVFDPVPY